MGRAIYPHELRDPDFSWLVDNFQDNNPEYQVIESSCLPVVLLERGTTASALSGVPAHLSQPTGGEETETELS